VSGFAKRSGGMLIPYGVHFCTRSLTPAPASAGDEVTLYLHRECECGGGHRRPSEAIRGHRRQSEAIRGREKHCARRIMFTLETTRPRLF